MRFEHQNGPGTIVQIGSRTFDLSEDFDDPADVALLIAFPGVQEGRKQKGPFDATEIAECTKQLTEAGLTPEEVEQALPGMLDLAAASLDSVPANKKKPPKEAESQEEVKAK